MIQVKHLIEYLSTLDQEAEVSLDKDGWFYQEGDDPVLTIANRGLFYVSSWGDKPHVIINN